MRYPPNQKKSTHERVLEVASRTFRERGHAATGVHGVMKSAGMTVGGFYAHFPSKDALFVESLEVAFQSFRSQWTAGVAQRRGRDCAAELVRRYLSAEHREDRAQGCPLPALAADAARSPERAREVFEEGLQQLVEEFEARLPGQRGEQRDRAIAVLSLCAGALLLSRAVKTAALGERILEACRRWADERKTG